MKTEIAHSSGLGVYCLMDKGWRHLKNAPVNAQLERETWLYRGDRNEAEQMLVHRQNEILESAKQYYSRQWV